MADGGRGPRCGLGLPGGPRLEPGGPVRSRPRRGGEVLRPLRGLPGRRGRLRRRVLFHRAQRGAGHGPAATPAAGGVLGGAGAGRNRPRRSARFGDGGVRRDLPRLLRRPGPGARTPGALRAARLDAERGVGPGGLLAGAGGPGRVGGHGLFVVVGGPAPGGAVAARRRVRPGAGRRRDGDGHPGDVHRVQPAAGAGRRWAVQGVRRCRRRHRVFRGRRCAGAGTAVRRAPVGASGAGAAARVGGQSGRRLQRAGDAQRALAAAGDPGRAGRRAPARRGRGSGGRARDGHHPRGSD